jgi:hypothetical protein
MAIFRGDTSSHEPVQVVMDEIQDPYKGIPKDFIKSAVERFSESYDISVNGRGPIHAGYIGGSGTTVIQVSLYPHQGSKIGYISARENAPRQLCEDIHFKYLEQSSDMIFFRGQGVEYRVNLDP